MILLAGLLILQNVLALLKYRKLTSFHTYAAKIAAVLQGIFLLAFFFFEKSAHILFYAAVGITVLDLAEEIILVIVLPEWKVNVKGLYWQLRNPSS